MRPNLSLKPPVVWGRSRGSWPARVRIGAGEGNQHGALRQDDGHGEGRPDVGGKSENSGRECKEGFDSDGIQGRQQDDNRYLLMTKGSPACHGIVDFDDPAMAEQTRKIVDSTTGAK